MATITVSKRVDVTEEGKHRLRIWVSETSHNIPPEIFVYQKIPTVPFLNMPEDHFVHIATYSDILDKPPGAPDVGNPFYRLGQVDLAFISRAKLEEKWMRMEHHIQHTIEDIVRLNKLPPAEVAVIEIN
jgi:hypothetical protein